LYHSTLGSRVIKKKKKKFWARGMRLSRFIVGGFEIQRTPLLVGALEPLLWLHCSISGRCLLEYIIGTQ